MTLADVQSSPRPIIVCGRIYRWPGDPAPAAAVGIGGGRVLAVGARAEVRSRLGRSADVMDLGDRIVLPGFVDSHTHFHRAALVHHLYLDFASLRPRSIADVLASVEAKARELPPDAWVQGDSISPGQLAEGRLPTRWELDRAAPSRPVILRGIGKHVVAANSLALALAGIDRQTPDPPGGRIERDEEGEPTGILHERAKLRLDSSHPESVVPVPAEAERRAALERGIGDLHRLGVTTIHEMVRRPEEAADFVRLWSSGHLGVRVRLFYRLHETPVALDWFAGLGLETGVGDTWLRIQGVKVSLDGFCIFANAALHEPYPEQAGNTGLLRIDAEELVELVTRSIALNLTVALHAVGSRAVDIALAAFEAARPFTPRRHRIEHAYLDVTEAQLLRMRELGLVWSVQPLFRTVFGQEWERLLGPKRSRRAMPLGVGRRVGLAMIFNSDVPTGPVGPIATIQAAVTPTDPEDPTPSMSVADAWAAHTIEPAEISGEPHGGRLVPGAPADLIIVDGNPFDCDWRTIADSVKIVGTMVNGKLVYVASGVLR